MLCFLWIKIKEKCQNKKTEGSHLDLEELKVFIFSHVCEVVFGYGKKMERSEIIQMCFLRR